MLEKENIYLLYIYFSDFLLKTDFKYDEKLKKI